MMMMFYCHLHGVHCNSC